MTTLNRRLESVIGLAASWFSEPLNGIVRTEAEYFIDELAFIPGVNLNPRAQIPASIRKALPLGYKTHIVNTIPTADYLRWVVAYDRFFFFRPLNPTNSFTLSMAFNSSFNLSEGSGRDFRNPQAKPGQSQTQTCNWARDDVCAKGTRGDEQPALRHGGAEQLRGRLQVRGLPHDDAADGLPARYASSRASPSSRTSAGYSPSSPR